MQIFDHVYLFAVTLIYPAALMMSAGSPVTPDSLDFEHLERLTAPVYVAETRQTEPEVPAGSAEAEAEAAAPAEASPIDQPAQEPSLEDVMEEISDLRAQMLRMEQSMESWFGTALTELKAENEALKRELREAYRQAGKGAPAVPTPNKELLEQVLKDPELAAQNPTEVAEAVLRQTTGADDAVAAPSPVDPEVAKAVNERGYLPIAEWGRSPEDAAKNDPPLASLKGMIAVVTPDVPAEQLEALGRRLRSEFDSYDNINIEIFSDREAANNFKTGLPVNEKHHVLSVSRHRASERDVILLLTGEKAVEISRDPKSASSEAASAEAASKE